MNTAPATVYADDLGLDTSDLPEDDYYLAETDTGEQPPSYDNDIDALNEPPVDADKNKPAGDTTPATDPANPAATEDQNAEVTFDQPAPIADWKERADKQGFTDVNSEADFRDQLSLSQYVQNQFFADPKLATAYQLVNGTNLPDKAYIEHHVRSKMEEFDTDEDVEERMSAYFDDDEQLTEKGKKVVAYVKTNLNKTIGEAVTKFEADGKAELQSLKEFTSTLQADIKALPATLYSAAEKRELDQYIRSGQYERDALALDPSGKPAVKGGEYAKRLLDNAQKVNPKFAEKRLTALHEDAKRLGVAEFIKKHLQ